MAGSVSVNNPASWLMVTYAEAPPVPDEFPTPATTKMGRVDILTAVATAAHNALALYTVVIMLYHRLSQQP